MWKNPEKIFIIISLLVLSVSCSDFRKIQKSTDWKVKYDAAIKYYENQDYYRSITLFDEIKPYIRGSKEAELVDFYYAYAHFYQKQYLLSSHYFKTFYDTYNRSEHAEEALYMNAFSLYKQSPVYDLDQSSTVEAITALQTFLNRYPNSQYREDVINEMKELMGKLEHKAFENAKLYYQLRDYNPGMIHSAMIALDNFIKDYPDSELSEEASFLLVQSAYRYAKLSIASKQKERYYDCINYYNAFVDNYPKSEHIKEIQGFYSDSLDAIEKLNARNL